MNCESNYSLFLRSNGTLVCWDDDGSLQDLQVFDPTINYATDVYLGRIYEGIREKLRRNEMPFPDRCSNCFCLRMNHPMDDGRYARERLIETFQIEPSMGCQLACPGCIRPEDRKTRVARTRHGHMTLKPEVLYKIAGDLQAAGIHVKKFDMQGHGEPLLNKKIWEMCGVLAKMFSKSIISICTHGNVNFASGMVTSGVNEVLFAIDGVDQESYAPWRVNGEFEKAHRFMREFSLAAATEAPHIERIWKYVLFSHNDSDAQLKRAQEMALEAKISTLRFVETQLGPGSQRRFRLEDIPRVDKALNIRLHSYRITPAQLRSALASLARTSSGTQEGDWQPWYDYLCTSLRRLFSTNAGVSAEYRAVIDDARVMLSDMPAASFGAVARNFREFLAELDSKAPGGKVGRTATTAGERFLPRCASTFSVAEAEAVARAVEVDEVWYVRQYEDVQLAIEHGLFRSGSDHYRLAGYFEGRLPFEPEVDEPWYIAHYADVADAITRGLCSNATDHFIQAGYREGRDRAMPSIQRAMLGVQRRSSCVA